MTQSGNLREVPTSKPDSGETVNLVDISAIAAAHPVNETTCRLDLNTFDASRLTLLEVLDMSEAVGVDPSDMASILAAGNKSPRKMRMLFALAWVVARRENKTLTYEQVCTWKLDVIGVIKQNPDTAKRAAIVVGAARLTGLPPAEAESLTLAELGAYSGAARRRRSRRAG
jgi:hypothetical protein